MCNYILSSVSLGNVRNLLRNSATSYLHVVLARLPFLPRYQDFHSNLTKFPVTLTNLYVYFESRKFGLSVRTRALCEQLITSRFLLSPWLNVCACLRGS